MSKQLSAFEALDIITFDYGYDENVIIIEKELKALDIIRNLPQEEKQILLNAIYTYTKNEKVFELLKEVLR